MKHNEYRHNRSRPRNGLYPNVSRDGIAVLRWFEPRHLAESTVSEIVCPTAMPPMPLDRVLREAFVGVSWTRCRALINSGKVTLDRELVRDIRRIVLGNCVVQVNPSARKPENRFAHLVRLVYWDSQIVVVDKPAGISTVPFDENERETLDELTRKTLGKVLSERLPPLGVVHRIDKETSGLVVFARTTAAKRHLKQQFRFHSNHRSYVALVNGIARTERIESRLVEDRGDGRRGSTSHPTLGRFAVTNVDVLDVFRSVSLVRCRLETGRTHQIRIHLSEHGHPLLGDRVYGTQTRESTVVVPRLMLHAAELGIVHPSRNEPMLFRAELPQDFESVLMKLRNSG
jgi:23S rRNA pseudouridine1911/1915/1917 synthase